MLPFTLSSILNQNYTNIEVLIVDDCSTDGTKQLIEEELLKLDNRIKYVRHAKNKGLAAARNTAIEYAKGEFFSFCDDDDVWPNGLALQLLNTIQTAPSGVAVAVALSSSRYSTPCLNIFKGYPKLSEVICRGYTPPVSSQLYKLEILKRAGGYNEDIKSGVDHDLWISLAESNPRVAASFGLTAVISHDPSVKRITANENGRREKIATSLLIWRPKIIKVFGEKFYDHFCHSYQQYMDFNFFMIAVKERKYKVVLIKALNVNVITLIVKKLLDKAKGIKRCNVFAEYKS